MNVGMTRARRKLLLVGDSSTLCSHPFFVDLLAYVKRIGGYLQYAGGIRARGIE
jgi:superfamily I DNA and/or RNA helicase